VNHRFFVFIFLVLVLPISGALPPDDQIWKMLIGTWIVPVKEYDAAAKQGGFTFNRDGTFTYFDVFRIDRREVRTEAKGKWWIKDGILIEEVTDSTHPESVPIGLVMQAPLLSVTEKEYRYRAAGGVERRRVRK